MGRETRGRRGGFTLIELLVVISIIGVLVGLLLPAVQKFKVAAKRAQASAEISQLANAIGAFKAKFNVDYIPSSFNRDNTNDQAYWKRLFPQFPTGNFGNLPPNSDLDDGNKCLVFFLSGGSKTNFTGFSANKQTPLDQSSTSRIGPFYEFPDGRLANGRYLDPWGTPYAYFTSVTGNDYGGSFSWNDTTVSPYKKGGRFVNQKGFQIISAGANGPNTRAPKGFGSGGTNWTPGGGEYEGTNSGADDLANFGNGPLSNDN